MATRKTSAISASKLARELKQREAELAIVNSVQEGLASKLEMQEIYDLVGDKIREIFNAQSVMIGTYDPDAAITHVNYLFVNGERQHPEDSPMSKFAQYFIDTQETVVINTNAEQRVEELGMFVRNNAQIPRSMLYVPMVVSSRVRGFISLRNMEQENAFSDSNVRLLETLANSMSVALENARLFDETEQRNAELAIINSVQEGLASKLEMQAIYDLVGDKIMEIFQADVVGIGLYDPALKALNHPYIVDHGKRFQPPPMPVPDEMVNYLKTHETTLLNTYQEACALMEQFGIHNIGGPTPDNSFIIVPLMINGEFMGRITVAKLPTYAFNQSDARLLQTLVNSMSVALENARLWEQEKMFRKALQRELEIGREIQQGFLPEALPVVEGWEIAASLMSAREVAGDFYDAFELPDGTLGLVIADVCDKGVGAALFMTLFRSLIRAAANLDYFEQTEKADAPHTSTERLQRAILLTNNYIAETHGESGMFATLFFGILDPRDGKLIYINGGHESPLIVRSGAVCKTLRKTGPAVGALANTRFAILETQMQAGDTFFAFTDGVPDCQNPNGEFFGREQLLDILRKESGSSHEVVRAIETELHRYTAGATQFDDITLLAVRRI